MDPTSQPVANTPAKDKEVSSVESSEANPSSTPAPSSEVPMVNSEKVMPSSSDAGNT